MRHPPSYTTLVAKYPRSIDKPTKNLLDEIGGQVRAELSDSVNTCAIRMSVALNKSGAPIRSCPGVYLLKGASRPGPATTGTGRAPSLYVIRAKEMKTYLQGQFGAGKLVYDGRKQAAPVFRTRQKQGVIVFDWLGPWAGFQAGGHVDLLRLVEDESGGTPRLLPSCEGHCYFLPERGPMRAFFWETLP